MKNDFNKINERLSRKFEDLLIEMAQIKAPSGLAILSNQQPLLFEFMKIMDSIELSYLSVKVALIPSPVAEKPLKITPRKEGEELEPVYIRLSQMDIPKEETKNED